jgi:cation diffusion facilitator CzcD-associated flavoprotein CzcO
MTAPNESYPQLIVGAGVSGVNTAVVFKEAGISYRVFERSGVNGGVWNKENPVCGSANSHSTVQIDPVAYTPPNWFLN